MGYRVFSDVNRIGRPNAVTSIPILLGHYRQLPKLILFDSLLQDRDASDSEDFFLWNIFCYYAGGSY